MIELENVSKWYGDFQVLSHCTTKVAKGEVVVVCGPSGSGKSTLIKCVNGLEPVQEGRITVDGAEVTAKGARLTALRSKIGMVFQHFELYPHMSVRDNLCLAQEKVLGRSRSEAEARTETLLDRVGMIEHIAKYPSQLSGGQQQRVAIARALAMDPIAMLFDEPTTGPRRWHDHDGRDPRNGLCPQGRRSRGFHGSGRDCRRSPDTGILR
jgi:glutamate/aspartate transport system ATP-binding protein